MVCRLVLSSGTALISLSFRLRLMDLVFRLGRLRLMDLVGTLYLGRGTSHLCYGTMQLRCVVIL